MAKTLFWIQSSITQASCWTYNPIFFSYFWIWFKNIQVICNFINQELQHNQDREWERKWKVERERELPWHEEQSWHNILEIQCKTWRDLLPWEFSWYNLESLCKDISLEHQAAFSESGFSHSRKANYRLPQKTQIHYSPLKQESSK